jgi:hypothetical protein
MNSKDLQNISEAYQNIQEERKARRRRPSKSEAQIKAEIDARNPTKTGPVTGQKVPGVQQSRPATRIPGATGEKPTGSLRSGNLSFPGDRSGAYDAAKQKLSTPKVEPPKVQTPPRTQGLLGTRNVPSTQELIQQRGGAPKPQFGPGSTNTGKSFPKPPRVVRDAGAAVRQRFMSRPPSAATVSRGVGLVRRLKGLAKGPLAVGAEIAADATLTPVAKAAGSELGKALTRGVASATGTTDKMRSRLPSYYGAKGPDLTRDIAQGVKSREPRGMSNIPPEEGMVNNPNYGKPVKRSAKQLSAAAKDFDTSFAAARKSGSKEFTWRGKKYSTKLKDA